MILAIRQRNKKDLIKKFMTKEFVTVEQIGNYLRGKLYEYYDLQIERMDSMEISGDDDYVEGLVDATSMALIKCGIEYMDFETYVDKADAAKWRKA